MNNNISPTIFVVPTGIGCEIGGFAGDALPAAKLIASATGCLITHPNVMNGGSLSEIDDRIYYVEGFSLDRFAKGEIGLRKVNKQRLGIIFDCSIDHEILVRHIQVADACVATLGINIDSIVMTEKPLGVSFSNGSLGISSGYISNPDSLIDAGKKLIQKGATAIAVVSKFPEEKNSKDINLYRSGKGVDSIAGVEAVISHLISKFLKVPCAHSPALLPIEIQENVDPRAASEEIGYTFLTSVLIGLSKAPDLIELPCSNQRVSLYPHEIESIVVPSGSLGGEAVLACMERDLTIIAVNNKSVLSIDNKNLNYPKIIKVNNYFEAAGVLLSLKEGINYKSINRPLKSAKELQIK